MASNINANNVDGSYPVAGQDNDSQGFRDNFTNIKTSLQFAKDEIEALQNSTVVLDGNNNMAGGTIRSAILQDVRESRIALNTGLSILPLDHALGHFYTVTSGSTMSVAFTNWPATGVLGRIRLQVKVMDTAHTLQLPSSVEDNLVGLAGYDVATKTITFSRTGIHELEFTSHDGGNTVAIKDFTNNRTTIEAVAPLTAIGKAGDIAGMIASDATYFYICTASYDGTTHIWKRVTLLAW